VNKFIAILYGIYVILYITGCSINGDVFIYSPQGEGIAVEKNIDGELGITIPLIP
jgi:hypothetical protein